MVSRRPGGGRKIRRLLERQTLYLFKKYVSSHEAYQKAKEDLLACTKQQKVKELEHRQRRKEETRIHIGLCSAGWIEHARLHLVRRT